MVAITTKSLSSGVLFLLCTAALMSCAAYGLETKTLNADLVVQTIGYRVYRRDSSYLEFTAEFTSTVEPDAEWTHGDGDGGTVVLDQTMNFANGRGTVSTRLPIGSTRSIVLTIGYFYVHYLQFVLRLPEGSTSFNKTYNAKLSTVTPGYEFTYVPGADSRFDVTTTVPKHIADGYTWRWINRTGEYYIDVDALYVNHSTHKIVSSIQNLDSFDLTDTFLDVEKTVTEDEATIKLTFDTTNEDINGYFQIFTFSVDPDSDVYIPELQMRIPMSWISEKIFITVHDNTTPGPFPVGYSYVRTSHNVYWKSCRENSGRKCLVFCYGYANGIAKAEIFRKNDGVLTRIDDVTVRRSNDHQAYFFTELDISRDVAGPYVCRLTSRENTTAEKIITIFTD